MKKVSSRIIAFLLCLVLCVSLSACGKEENGESATPTAAPTEAPANPADPEGGESTGEKTPHKSANGIDTSDNGVMRADLKATELTVLMGNGINLGNTMEAIGGENAWGMPTTTQDMVTEMKNGGFDCIRVPVAWTNAMPDYKKGIFCGTDYADDTMDPANQEEYFKIQDYYLDRVEEIINYAINADMYVIVNDHWDNQWWGYFGFSDEAVQANAMAMYKSMWTQISNRYAEYSDYLIFEGGNEEFGTRFNDDVSTPDGSKKKGKLSLNECYAKATEVSQAFVDTVRATGGNNENRFLLIPGINTDFDMTCNDLFVMPTDTADSKLLISVHYYTPWGFCGEAGLTSWGSLANLEEMNNLYAAMAKYVDQGYGIIVGEYAVLPIRGGFKDDTAFFYENMLDNCDLYNMVPVLWDCSNLFDRSNLEWTDETIAKVFTDRKAVTDDEATKAEKAKANIEARVAAAKEELAGNLVTDNDEDAVAWIMYNSGDYGVTYSVGNEYTPENATSGLIAKDCVVEGEGEYTVSLDFSDLGGANGIAFMALGIRNGQEKFPGATYTITDIKVDGASVDFEPGYSTCDDKRIGTDRVNIYNEWVSDDSWAEGCTSMMVDKDDSVFRGMTTFEVTFTVSLN